jgi:hypothetical protein
MSDNKNSSASTDKATLSIKDQAGAEPPKVEKKSWPKVGRVRSAVGRMVHLHQPGVVIDGESDKKITIDGFARAQLDAGKWILVTD